MLHRKRFFVIVLIAVVILLSLVIYSDQRRLHVVESRYIAEAPGIPVHILGQGPLPGIQLLDELLWHDELNQINTTKKYDNGKIVIHINSYKIRKNAQIVEKDWQSYIDNHKYFIDDDPRWESARQSIYNFIGGDTPRDLVAEKYALTMYRMAEVHEARHATDNVDDYAPADSEVRAYLSELMISPAGFKDLEQHESRARADSPYYRAAERIFAGFLSYPDTSNKRDLYTLTEKIVKLRASELFHRWYGHGQPHSSSSTD